MDAAEGRTAHVSREYVTWSQCCMRNKNKMELLYRGTRTKDSPVNDEWTRAMSWQKKKLMRLYDPHEAWRKREDLVLKRMNAGNFPRNEAPDVPWRLRVYKLLQKQKKLVRERRPKRSDSSTESTFDRTIRQAKKRLREQYRREYTSPDEIWTMNMKANRLKINSMHLRGDWHQTIFENREKLRYWYYKHAWLYDGV